MGVVRVTKAVDWRSSVPAGVATFFACEWEQMYASPSFLEAAEQQMAGVWADYTSANNGPAVQIVQSDSGLTNRGDYFRVLHAGENSRQVEHANMINAEEDHWGRIYIRSNNTTVRQDHHLNMGDNAGSWAFGFIQHGGQSSLMISTFLEDGTWGGRYTMADVDNPGDEDYLTQDAWYLLEWQVAWRTSTTFRLDVWVHEVDSLGMITTEDKWTTEDFWPNDSPGSGTNLDAAQLPAADHSGIQGGLPAGAERMYVFGNAARSGAGTDGGYTDYASFALSNVGRLRDQEVTTGTSR